ncbi:RNA-binding protein [Cytobacillus sp. Hz8]|uniref:YlmH family RNA-binding protein n=1 Tax=Cytobacillus sp. Hz8 TaxID=3347168 RepID=UPI0035DE071C
MNIYQHFRPEERDFIDSVLQWKDDVENTFAPKLTDFLDPRQQHIVKLIIGQGSEVQCQIFGGAEGTERKRALLYTQYDQIEPADFKISLYEINYPSKFLKIEHSQVLGTLMSLGLKRGKFGDILVHHERAQFFATSEVGHYILTQLSSIGRAKVQIEEISLDQALVTFENWKEVSVTATSLRLDVILSTVYQISRAKSQALIVAGLVKVNWTTIESSSFECQESDLLSVRGLGRSKILSIEGKTKKDKWKVNVGKQN